MTDGATTPNDPALPTEPLNAVVPEAEDDLLNQPGDADSPEPLDGRDGQPAAGGSDEPELLDAEDPLKDPQRAADESDTLLTETPLPEDPVG